MASFLDVRCFLTDSVRANWDRQACLGLVLVPVPEPVHSCLSSVSPQPLLDIGLYIFKLTSAIGAQVGSELDWSGSSTVLKGTWAVP